MGVTKKELAETLGVAKQTVVNYIDKLDLSPDHVTRMGKYDVLDDFAASAIANAVGKSMPPKTSSVENGTTTSDAVLEALNARIADLKEQNDRLTREIEDLKSRHGREIDALRSQADAANERANAFAGRLADMAERQQAIAALPWWKRSRIAVKLLGAGTDEN